MPKPQSDPDDIDPGKYVEGLEREDVQFEPKDLLEWLHTRRVFFYPAAGLEDWYPLHYFSHPDDDNRDMLSDLFVLCDWARQAADFEKAIRDRKTLNRERPAGSHLECRVIRKVQPEHLGTASVHANFDFLTDDEKAAYQDKYEQCAVRKGWGCLAEIVREDQNDVQRFPLLYLGAEGVATYLKLFAGQCIIPHVLCIKNPGVGFDGWTQFNDWAAPLGRAVALGAEKCGREREPKYLVTDRAHDWPWTKRVNHHFKGWKGTPAAYKRPEKGVAGGREKAKNQSGLPNPWRKRNIEPGDEPPPKTWFFFGSTRRERRGTRN